MRHSPGTHFLFLHHQGKLFMHRHSSYLKSVQLNREQWSSFPVTVLYKGTFAIWLRHWWWWEMETATLSFSVAGVIWGYHMYQRVWCLLWEKKPRQCGNWEMNTTAICHSCMCLEMKLCINLLLLCSYWKSHSVASMLFSNYVPFFYNLASLFERPNLYYCVKFQIIIFFGRRIIRYSDFGS